MRTFSEETLTIVSFIMYVGGFILGMIVGFGIGHSERRKRAGTKFRIDGE